MKTPSHKNICISLSLGSTHTSMVIANCEKSTDTKTQQLFLEKEQDKFQILGAARITHNGAIKKGVISSIDAVSASLLETMDEVERQSGIDVESVRVCIAGTAAQFDNHMETYTTKGEEIKDSDLEKISQSVRRQQPLPGTEVIHMIPSSYSVDGKHGIQNPIGMRGTTLSLMHHRIFYPFTDLHNIIRACNNAGIRVQNFAFEPLAVAESVLTRDEKEFGCLSLSIGAQLTHLCVYLGNVPVYTKEYPIGAHYITKDLSIGLRTTQAEAERIKKDLGKAMDTSFHSESNEKIKMTSVDGNTVRFVTRMEVNKIIEPRVKEILQIVYLDLKRSKLLTRTSKGIILSGGGALLSGMTLATEEVFGLQTRMGVPINIIGAIEGLKSPLWTSTIGALSPLFSPTRAENTVAPIEETSNFASFATKIWHRLKDPFASK